MHEEIIVRPIPKTYEEHKEHFLMRLHERYGFACDYKEACGMKFNSLFRKTNDKKIGYIYLNKTNILVLKKHGMLATCYPENAASSTEQMIRLCFSRDTRSIATSVWGYIEAEIEQYNKDGHVCNRDLFTKRNYVFKSILHHHQSGTLNKWIVARMVKDIINGTHPLIKVECSLK